MLNFSINSIFLRLWLLSNLIATKAKANKRANKKTRIRTKIERL
nr:MAG TPA: hypothetical protein [Caudoviricetes sp.]